jgi:hypothetical protein
MGVWTGTSATGTVVEDVDVDRTRTGIYIEHFTSDSTFQRLHVRSRVRIGIVAEWASPGWGGRPASVDNVIQDSTFESYLCGVYLDEGTTRTTVRRSAFRRQAWAAIGDYRGNGNRFSRNDYSGIRRTAVPVAHDRGGQLDERCTCPCVVRPQNLGVLRELSPVVIVGGREIQEGVRDGLRIPRRDAEVPDRGPQVVRRGVPDPRAHGRNPATEWFEDRDLDVVGDGGRQADVRGGLKLLHLRPAARPVEDEPGSARRQLFQPAAEASISADVEDGLAVAPYDLDRIHCEERILLREESPDPGDGQGFVRGQRRRRRDRGELANRVGEIVGRGAVQLEDALDADA